MNDWLASAIAVGFMTYNKAADIYSTIKTLHISLFNFDLVKEGKIPSCREIFFFVMPIRAILQLAC